MTCKKDCPYFEENCPGGLATANEELTCECAKYKAYLGARNPEVVKQQLEKMNITATGKMNIMYSMQKQFASRFHKLEGLTKEEMDYWTNSYLVCIEDEVVEAEEFLDIYTEKIKDFNKDEYKKELIDVFHFLMDGMLVCGMTYEDMIMYYKDSNNELLEDMVKNEAKELDKIPNDDKNLYLLNYLFRDIRLVRQCISWKHWKKPSDTIDKDKIFNAYIGMFKHLVQAFIAIDVTAEEIYDIYIHKNIENVLRQEYGYLSRK